MEKCNFLAFYCLVYIFFVYLQPKSNILFQGNDNKKETDMRDFFLHDNRALLVEGARQTGKTFSIRRVGKECFDTFVENLDIFRRSTGVS